MKQFMFFIITGGEGGKAFEFVLINIEDFYFCFLLPTVKIAKLIWDLLNILCNSDYLVGRV